MDLDYIRRKAQAARQFEHVVGPATFTLQVPTKLQSSIAYAQAAGARDAATGVRFERALAVVAVVGWAGVLVRHVLPAHEAGDEAFAYEIGAAELLFDAQPEWEVAVLQAVMARVAERSAVEDTAAKN